MVMIDIDGTIELDIDLQRGLTIKLSKFSNMPFTINVHLTPFEVINLFQKIQKHLKDIQYL